MEFSFIDLLNSYWHDYKGGGQTEDRLPRPDWLTSFLTRWEFGDFAPPDQKTLANLIALREFIRALTEAIGKDNLPDNRAVEQLNYYLALATVKTELVKEEGYRVDLVPVEKNWDWVMSQIAASFAGLLVQYEPHRLKICENADCKWVFYDESRNHAQRWCSDTCANLIKVRRFRARHKNLQK
jgi:predicted RNA-binding Zn ribbon-like protein